MYFAGLTWQDKLTQSIIDKELRMVDKILLSSGSKNKPKPE